MTDLVATCPGCRLEAKLPATLAGRTVKCPRCDTRFTAAAAGPAPTTPEARPAPAPTRPEPRPPAPTVPEKAPPAPTQAEPVAPPSAPRPAARTPGDWQPGDVVLDLYRVTGVLGQGGMGRVYRVRHLGWDLDLAVKAPLPEVLEALGGAELFEKEAETWVNLGLHPHVVSCHYVRRVAGLPMVFAEFVDGGSLHDAIRSRRLRTVDALLDAAIQFAWGLHYAHELGLVHRDVKPANVMTGSDGLVKVTDFGLARARPGVALPQGLRGGHTLVVPGGVAGTPAYMPPEQSAGEALTRRADLWSWALSVLEMFQGGRTWEYGVVAADALEQYVARGSRVVGLPPMPAGVVDLLRRCFRDAPDERPRSLWDAAAVLYAAYEEATGSPYPRAEPQAGRATADSLTNRAVSLLDLGRDAEAPPLWDAALRAEPRHLEATYDQALHAWSAGRLNDDELLARVQEAVGANPSARAQQLAGRAWLATGDAPRAAAALQAALDGGLATAEVERELALALCAAGGADRARWERAADLLGRARQAGHEDDVELCATALCLLRLGETSRAERFVADAAERRRDVPRDLAAALASHVPGQEVVRVVRGLAQPAVAVTRAGLLVALEGDTLRVREPDGSTPRTLQPPELRVRCFAPLGRSVLCGGEGAPLQLVDAASGRVLRVFARHAGTASSVAVSGDGRLAVAGGSDRVVRVFDVATGAVVHALAGHAEGVSAVAVSADGRIAASGALDGRVCVWDLETGARRHELEGGRGRVVGLAVTDAGLLLALGEDRRLRRWDLDSGRLVHAFGGPTQAVHAFALAPGEGFAAVGGADRAVRVWDLARGRIHAVVRLESAVTALAFDGDGAVWAAAGHALLLVRLPPRPRLPAFAVARPVSAVEVEQREAAFQTQLAQAQETLRTGDVARALALARTLRSLPGFERAEPALALWDEIGAMLPKKGVQAAWEAAVLEGHTDPVLAVAVSADGGRVVSAGMDRSVRLWDPSTRELLARLDGHADSVTSVALAADGRTAVSGSWDQTVRVWDLAASRATRVLEGHRDHVTAVATAPDGALAASGSRDQTLALWDLATGARLRELSGHDGPVAAVAFAPDGRFVASAGADGTVRAWDVATGECGTVLTGHEDNVAAVAVSPSGRQVASAGADRTVRVWDLRSRRALRTFTGHEAEVAALAFCPDGRYLWSASRDKTLRLWDLAGGKCERVVAHTAALLSVAVHPAGHAVVAGGADRTVRSWHVDWEPDARPPAAWDEQAKPFLETFVSLRLKPQTVRAAASGTWSERDVDGLVADLHRRGFGGVTRETVAGKLQDLAARERQAGAYWEEVRRAGATARPVPARVEKRPLPWARIAAGAALVLSVALLVAVFRTRDPRLLPFMVERHRKAPGVIPLAAHAGDCSAGDRSYWLDQATRRNVSAPTLACLASLGDASTVDDYLERATLDDIDSSVRQQDERNAVSLLVALGEPAADRLCARLGDERTRGVVTQALTVLLAGGSAAAADCVARSIDDTTALPATRAGAAALLRPLLASGRHDDAAAWALLARYRADADPDVRRQALGAYAMFDADAAARVLEAAKSDPDERVRAAAAATLAESKAGRLYDR